MTVVSIETVSAVDAVAMRLRERIFEGNLRPGALVTEHEVATLYGVARPTAKSAITALIAEGLLGREANKPAKVPELSADDVADLFLVRIPLELEALRLVTESGQVLPALYEAVRDIPAMREAPLSKFVEAELRFHRLLVESVASRRLTRLYRAVQGEIHMSMIQSRRPLRAEHLFHEHGDVVDAIRAKDTARAAELMRAHLDGMCHEISNSVGSYA